MTSRVQQLLTPDSRRDTDALSSANPPHDCCTGVRGAVSDGAAPAATKARQGAPTRPEPGHAADPDWAASPTDRPSASFYSREQAAQALGISLATLDRRVVPAIATVKTEWGARLIPATEFDRYLAEHTEAPRTPRRRQARLRAQVDTPSRRHRAHPPTSARKEAASPRSPTGSTATESPTGQGGRRWWPSTVLAILDPDKPALA